jgi:Exocyst complex component Sec5
VYLDPDDDTLAGLYGLLQACGTTSSHAEGGGSGASALKRSARPAMVLVKELLLDWKESSSSKKDDLNVICQSFLELPVHYYSSSMQLDAHCSSGDHHNTNRQDTRGGAKQEACELIVLILTKHMSEDGQSAAPVTLEEILLQPKAQQEFELWSARHISATVKEVIKKNTVAREAELVTLQRQDALANKADEFLDLEDATENEDDTEHGGGDHEEGAVADDDDAAYDKDDVVATMRKRRKDLKMAMKTAVQSGEMGRGSAGVATRWEDSLVAREQQARAAAAARGNAAAGTAAGHDTVRDSQEAAKEEAERNEGKAKVMGKDPLEIVTVEDFDLRHVEKSQAEYMEQALHDVQTEMQKAEAMNATDELRAKVTAQKESLEALIDRMGGIEAMENVENLKYSVLPTSPKFDPILFLTLVHRSDNYDTLVGSLDRLSSKSFVTPHL